VTYAELVEFCEFEMLFFFFFVLAAHDFFPLLILVVFRSHDPTQLNAQGHDRGTQYRSALFPHNEDQTSIVKKVMAEVQEKVCVTEIHFGGL
jgi:hypothetical protein